MPFGTDYSIWEVGGTTFPLATSTGNTLFQDADPALFYIRSYFGAMLINYIGPRLLAQFSAYNVQLPTNPATAITSAVMQEYAWEPSPYLAQNQFLFPLLAIWRTAVTSSVMLTASYEHDKVIFGCSYTLPPLNAGQAENVLPILGAAYKTLRHCVTAGWDPSYTPPGGSGVTPGPWSAAFANLEEIGITSAKLGELPGEGNLHFPSLLIEGYFFERENQPSDAVTGRSKFTGGDIAVNLQAPDGTSIPNFLQASTQVAPVITSLNVTTGSVAGGTAVTITGTGFDPSWQLPGFNLYFGTAGIASNLATSVVVVNATTITCVTPAVSGPGVVAVTFTNGDGQSASLGSAYTYTSP